MRKAEINDYLYIVDFQIQMALETENTKLDRTTVERGVKSVFEDTKKGMYYVTVLEDTIIASLLITFEWSDWRNGNVWWIQSLYVKKHYRKKGIFKKMYQFLLDTIQNDPKIMGIRLYVNKTNKTAQEVYTKIGMNGEHYQVYEYLK
ncbi:MAG: GNAT family N-acetyltransferase [Chitinophagaceae bacterium]|nr:GNAT family N-acetyltransferase [Chitinophagaceae bacterium]